MPKILTVGEIIWDMYPDKKVIGGAGLNFAAHSAKCGAKSHILSAVGRDELGDEAISAAASFGVGCDFIARYNFPTGQCIVTLNERGIPAYNVLSGVAYDNITLADTDIEKITQIDFDAICFGTLIQRSRVTRETLRDLLKACSFKDIICDVNLRKDCYDSSSALFCLENATILKISDEEEPALRQFGYYTPEGDFPVSIAAAIADRFTNIKYIIITLGENGAFVYCTNEKRHFTMPAAPAKVASTVGAGDSFIAAWATSILSGSTPEVATEKAIALSGFVVSKAAAIPDYKVENGILYEL